MLKKIRKSLGSIEKELFTRRALCGLIVQMTLVLLLPLLYIGKYNHAVADCYWYAFWPYCAWQNTHNLFEVFLAACKTVADRYTTWQGTFTSIFFFSLSPVAFGEQYMFIVPYMMIGMTFVSTFFLFYVLLKKLLHFDWYSYISVTCIAAVMQIEFMYTPASGLYWYNGAVHYVFMQGFVNFTVAFAALLLDAAGRKDSSKRTLTAYTIFTSLAAFMASGANFSTTLLNMEIAVLILLIAVIMCWKAKKKGLPNRKYLLYIIPFAVSLVGFSVNVLAPGNANRQAYFEKGSFVKTILLSFSYGTKQASRWITVFVVLYLLLLIPFILKAVEKTEFRFPCPLLVLLGVYCLYASMFAPGFYAFGGSEPLSRNQNICKMFLLMSLVLCEVYLIGWLEKKLRIVQKLVPKHGKNIWIWTGFVAVCATMFVASFFKLDFVEKKATFVSYGAYDVIITGDGEKYHEEYLIRLNEYKNNDDSVVYVEPYSVEPYPLWINSDSEKSEKESGELNTDVAKWYGKQAIYESR